MPVQEAQVDLDTCLPPGSIAIDWMGPPEFLNISLGRSCTVRHHGYHGGDGFLVSYGGEMGDEPRYSDKVDHAGRLD